MATCKDCLHYDICIFHLTGNENEKCKQFLNTADVAPKTEVAREIITEIADFIWQGESEKMNFPFDNRYYNKQEFIAELKKKYVVTDTNVGNKCTEGKE